MQNPRSLKVYRSDVPLTIEAIRSLREFLESPQINDEKALHGLIERHPCLIGPLGFVEFVSEYPLHKVGGDNEADLTDLRRRDRADLVASTRSTTSPSHRIANIIELKAAGLRITGRDVGFRLDVHATDAVQQLREYREWLTRIPQNRSPLRKLGWEIGWPKLFLLMGRDSEFQHNPGRLEEMQARLLDDGVQLFTTDEVLRRAIRLHEDAAVASQRAGSLLSLVLPTGQLAVLQTTENRWRPQFSLERDEVLSDLLHQYGLPQQQELSSGLILFSGATGTGKTTYLNGVLDRFLQTRVRPGTSRRQHVIAIGDPPEINLPQDNLGAQSGVEPRKLDITPRHIPSDVQSVRAALTDALRQTPSAVVVSELRRDTDFKAAVEFASTGQVIFATCLALDLADTWKRLFTAVAARTSEDRSELAQRMVAVIHHRRVAGPNGDRQTWLNIPAVWRGNPQAKKALVSDGLASLIAKAPSQLNSEESGVLGRHWWAKQLHESMDWKLVWDEPLRQQREALYRHFLARAHQMDLNSE